MFEGGGGDDIYVNILKNFLKFRDSIPQCTLHNFPNQIEHCIQLGRDKFEKYFVSVPKDLNNYLQNPE